MRIDAYNKIGQMYQVNTKKPVNKQSKAQKSDKDTEIHLITHSGIPKKQKKKQKPLYIHKEPVG